MARLSPATASRRVTEHVVISNDRGSLTFAVVIEPKMVDGVVWVPRRAPESWCRNTWRPPPVSW